MTFNCNVKSPVTAGKQKASQTLDVLGQGVLKVRSGEVVLRCPAKVSQTWILIFLGTLFLVHVRHVVTNTACPNVSAILLNFPPSLASNERSSKRFC